MPVLSLQQVFYVDILYLLFVTVSKWTLLSKMIGKLTSLSDYSGKLLRPKIFVKLLHLSKLLRKNKFCTSATYIFHVVCRVTLHLSKGLFCRWLWWRAFRFCLPILGGLFLTEPFDIHVLSLAKLYSSITHFVHCLPLISIIFISQICTVVSRGKSR